MKRKILLGVGLFLLAGALWAAGSREAGSAAGAGTVARAGVFPIMSEKTTMELLMPVDVTVEDYETNKFTTWYEDYTNIVLDFNLVPGDDFNTKVNLLFSSGTYPDMVMGGLNLAQEYLYGQQGILVPLNDYIDEYGVNTKKVYAAYPVVEDLITMPDANVYSIPRINDCYHCSMSQKLWVYTPWLDALGLDVPQTTEEFRDMLIAFKTKDPNGNGIADEIPLAGAITGWHANIDGFLMGSFIYDDSETTTNGVSGARLFMDGNRVVAAYLRPEWREGLRYLHGLYADGLIAPESFTQQSAQLKQLGENPNIPILGAVTAGGFGVFSQQYGTSGRWLEFKPIPPLEGPEGVRWADYDPYVQFETGFFAVTSKAAYPVAAFRWADAMYDTEITLRASYGVPDVDWKWADADQIGINGKPAIWEQLDEFGTVQNQSWREWAVSWRSTDFRLGAVAKGEQDLETILYQETRDKMAPYAIPAKMALPKMVFDEQTIAELVDLELSISKYVDSSTVRFITGDLDVETDWDGYLDELALMKIDRYLEIYQTGYDQKYK